MKIINLLGCFTIAVLLSSCSHKISRVDYDKPAKNACTSCDVVIEIDNIPSNANSKLLGRLKLKDSGFSIACNESDARAILKAEACALQGNYVNIIEVKEPNFGSTCYQCTAEIYSTSDSALIVNNLATQKQENFDVLKRDISRRKNNRDMIIGSLVGGFVVGFLIAVAQ